MFLTLKLLYRTFFNTQMVKSKTFFTMTKSGFKTYHTQEPNRLDSNSITILELN